MRLIDGDALKNDLMESARILQEKGSASYAVALAIAANVVDVLPAVDTVEVVRCKNCLFAGQMRGGAEKYFNETCLLCSKGRGDPSLGFSVVLPDDFCSDGVRQDKKGGIICG